MLATAASCWGSTALKVPRASPNPSVPRPPSSTEALAAVDAGPVSAGLRFAFAVRLESHAPGPLQTGFFGSAICTYVSSESFWGLIAHFFLLPDDIPW